jgi:hypothetical protein
VHYNRHWHTYIESYNTACWATIHWHTCTDSKPAHMYLQHNKAARQGQHTFKGETACAQAWKAAPRNVIHPLCWPARACNTKHTLHTGATTHDSHRA